MQYRDRQDRMCSVSEVGRLKVVSAAIEGPNIALVIRFEREERFARWIGGKDWRASQALDRLFHRARARRVGRAPTAADADTA